jgi:serine/threonine-protein kinase
MGRIEQDVNLGGRYRLVDRIAAGGMATVWEAEDTVLHRRVAVKLMSESLGADPRFVERFRREARAAAGLSHPNIAGVFDYGEEGDTPFLVMELIRGETLADRIARDGRLPPSEAAGIAAEVAEALQAAHDAGVIHRDVKPGNVMLEEGGRVRVMDFGIAAASWAAPITATGTTLGTAGYLAPEQAAGGRASPTSDIYALGCVLYEMLAGRLPFTGDSPVSIAVAHARETPPPVNRVAPGVPPALAAACEQALSKNPADRPPTAAAFAEMLRTGQDSSTQPLGPVATTQVVASPTPTAVLPTTPREPGRPRRTWLWIVLAGLASLVGLGLLLAALTGPTKPPTPEPSPRATTPPAQEAPTSTVPEVVGLRLSQALAELAGAGITNVDVQAADEGRPGRVVDVQPGEGETVSEDDPVTLFVGPPRGQGDAKGGNGSDEGDGD